MKKIIFLSMFMLLMLLTLHTPAEASFREVKVVNGSALTVKAQATTSSATVATLKKGDFVTVFSTTNGWASIQSGNSKGYVNASFLATPTSSIKIASSKGGLVVKAHPSRSAQTLATLSYNMIVEDFGTVGGGWSFVQYGNVTGYVASTFINVPATTTKTTKEAVSLRNIASPSGAITSTLPAATKVTIHSTIAGWSYVSAGSKRGYVEAAKLFVPKTVTTAHAKDYLPACPKTYIFESIMTDDYSREVDYNYFNCSFESGGRYFKEVYDDYDVYSMFYSLKGTNMNIGFYEGHQEFHFPLQAGKRWTYESYAESYETFRVVSLNEVVTTPAGTFFNVIKLVSLAEDSTYYVYLAPNLGRIKTEYISTYGGERYSYVYQLYSVQ